MDGSGNVYVTVWSVGSGTSEDYCTIKYDSAGNELWVARYNGPGNSAEDAQAIAVDGSGNVYITGGSEVDYATVKYDLDGNEIWVTHYDGPANGTDSARGMVVDALGNIYVTGGSDGVGTGRDYATIKYVQQPTIEANVDFAPDSLRLESKGKWITCYIELPEGYEVEDIDIGTVMLNETIPAERSDIQDVVLMVKFDRSDVQDMLEPGDEVEVTVSGELTDGTPFEGTDTIRVLE